MPLPTQVPAGYPKTGEYQGKPIDLAQATKTLSSEELADVVVEVPGVGRIRPWRFATDDIEVS